MKQNRGPLFDSGFSFPTTDWKLIRNAQDSHSPKREETLDAITRHYWKPLHSYYRSQRQSAADAEDLVQGLLVSIIQGDKLGQVVQPKGHFRNWLIACAKNYLRDHIRRSKARKRWPRGGLISFENMKGTDGAQFDAPEDRPPEMASLRAWRHELLTRSLDDVQAECAAKGRGVDYLLFAAYYMCLDEQKPTWKQLAVRHELGSWKEAARKSEWVKSRLNRAIRKLIRSHVDNDGEADDALRQLLD